MSDPPASGGSVAIDPEGDPVVKQCWPIVKQFINLASNKMTHILGKFGVPANEKSPFCRSFETPKDLMDALIKFLPHTFSYPDVSGASSQPSDAVDDVDEATQVKLRKHHKALVLSLFWKKMESSPDKWPKPLTTWRMKTMRIAMGTRT